jgi:hypothetical protein
MAPCFFWSRMVRFWGNGERSLFSGDNPYRMNNSWEITQKSQDEIDPKVSSNANLQENTQRWKKNSDEDTDEIHKNTF